MGSTLGSSYRSLSLFYFVKAATLYSTSRIVVPYISFAGKNPAFPAAPTLSTGNHLSTFSPELRPCALSGNAVRDCWPVGRLPAAAGVLVGLLYGRHQASRRGDLVKHSGIPVERQALRTTWARFGFKGQDQ